MDTIKNLAATLFLIVLLTSNIGIIMEGLLVIFPPISNYNFAGNQTVELEDLDTGVLAVAADKMNAFYIGVENPITIAASGIEDQYLKLGIEGGKAVRGNGRGRYVIHCSKPGKATLKITNVKTGKYKRVDFRVKRLPDPIVRLGTKTDGLMGAGEFRAQLGLIAQLDNVDMDLRCTIGGYDLYYTCKGCDPIQLQGQGGRFTGTVADVIRRAKPGDQYAFTNVKANCPGDVVARKINGLSFKIK